MANSYYRKCHGNKAPHLLRMVSEYELRLLKKSCSFCNMPSNCHIPLWFSVYKINYREALLKGLTAGNIIGHNSKIETRLQEGLDAVVHNGKTGKKAVAYETRLRYAQEINKITGVYAPQQSNTARFNLNVDATQEQMDTRIRGIQEQLADTT